MIITKHINYIRDNKLEPKNINYKIFLMQKNKVVDIQVAATKHQVQNKKDSSWLEERRASTTW